MYKPISYALVWGLCAALSFGADVPKPATANRPAVTRGVPDADLERAIRARFSKSKVNEDKFEIKVQGGIATLTGRTSIMQRKGVATRLAKNAGAREVINKIEITGDAKQKAFRAKVMDGAGR